MKLLIDEKEVNYLASQISDNINTANYLAHAINKLSAENNTLLKVLNQSFVKLEDKPENKPEEAKEEAKKEEKKEKRKAGRPKKV